MGDSNDEIIASDVPNSPGLTKNLKVHTPAILDIGQACSLVDSLKNENRDRNLRNSRIQEKYNSERPYDPNRLTADGLSWKANFSTKPLATLVDKVVPRFTTALRNMRYLTASKLPERFSGAAEKTEAFRRAITETCRQNENWEELMSEIAQENSLFGYAGVGWLDSASWFPIFFRQDEFLVPQGTKHTSISSQVVCLRQSYLLHELFDTISEPDKAGIAGWNVANVIESLNSAVPEARRSKDVDMARIYADLTRENSVLTSFQGSKTVEVWHVLVAEVDGRITHVAFDDKSRKQLFWREKQFLNMADACTFFSLQHGNGKLHGSKGIGRELYNMAAILDRSRNEVVDRLQLSGKLVISCEDRDIKRFRMSVIGNAILIASGYNIQNGKIDGNVEPFFALDRFLTDLLDQIAGSTSPKIAEGERVTKAAVEIAASREEEKRDAVIERFLTQFARMMSTIQRRLCDERSIDRAAKEMQAELLKIMSREELDYLSKQAAVNSVPDFSENERQRIVLITQEARGNPLYNQHELERQSLTARMNADFAESVLLPVNDPTEQNENVRQQKLEMALLKNGQTVEISPRDNHAVHIQTIQAEITPLLQHAIEDSAVLPSLDAIGRHAMEHVETAESLGQGKSVEELKKWVQELGKTLAQLEQADADHAAELASQQAEIEAQGGPQAQVDEAGNPVAPAAPRPSNNDNVTIPYDKAPPSIQRQMEIAAGFEPATETPDEIAALERLKKPQPVAAPAPVEEAPQIDWEARLKLVPYSVAPPSIQRQLEIAAGFKPATDAEALSWAKSMTKATTIPKPKTPTPKA